MTCADPQARRDPSGLESPGPGKRSLAASAGEAMMFAAPRTLTTAVVALATIAAAAFVVLALALGQGQQAQGTLALRTSPTETHDAWVVGDEPVVVADWYGASNYATSS
jgi:hypothetical protein